MNETHMSKIGCHRQRLRECQTSSIKRDAVNVVNLFEREKIIAIGLDKINKVSIRELKIKLVVEVRTYSFMDEKRFGTDQRDLHRRHKQ